MYHKLIKNDHSNILAANIPYQPMKQPGTYKCFQFIIGCWDVHASSFHAMNHKMAGYNSFIHLLITILINKEDYNKELSIIKHMATNSYNINIIDRLINKRSIKKKEWLGYYSTQRPRNKSAVSWTINQSLYHTLKKKLNKHNIKITCRTSNKLEK